jgi:signal peptidase I
MRWLLRHAVVSGPSMVPALRDGDRVLVWLSPRPARPGRVVLVGLPDRPLSVKRLTRRDPRTGIWVEGDNPFGSTDSRQLGWLGADALRGVVLVRVWPSPGRVR